MIQVTKNVTWAPVANYLRPTGCPGSEGMDTELKYKRLIHYNKN